MLQLTIIAIGTRLDLRKGKAMSELKSWDAHYEYFLQESEDVYLNQESLYADATRYADKKIREQPIKNTRTQAAGEVADNELKERFDDKCKEVLIQEKTIQSQQAEIDFFKHEMHKAYELKKNAAETFRLNNKDLEAEIERLSGRISQHIRTGGVLYEKRVEIQEERDQLQARNKELEGAIKSRIRHCELSEELIVARFKDGFTPEELARPLAEAYSRVRRTLEEALSSTKELKASEVNEDGAKMGAEGGIE